MIRLSCRSCGTSTVWSHTSGRRSTSSTVSPTNGASASFASVRSFASGPKTWSPGLNHRWSIPPLWPRPCGGVVRAIGTGPHESPARCAPARVAERDRDVGSPVVRLGGQAAHSQLRHRCRDRGSSPSGPARSSPGSERCVSPTFVAASQRRSVAAAQRRGGVAAWTVTMRVSLHLRRRPRITAARPCLNERRGRSGCRRGIYAQGLVLQELSVHVGTVIDAQDVGPRRLVVDAVQQPVGSAASAERTR